MYRVESLYAQGHPMKAAVPGDTIKGTQFFIPPFALFRRILNVTVTCKDLGAGVT